MGDRRLVALMLLSKLSPAACGSGRVFRRASLNHGVLLGLQSTGLQRRFPLRKPLDVMIGAFTLPPSTGKYRRVQF